jgi:hypothetical protein
MNKALLIGIIVVIVVMVVFLIAAATREIINAAEAAVWFGIPLAGWIYLVWMVWKKKTNIFHDQMEPKPAESLLKRLKIFLLVGGMSFAMFWLNILVGIFDEPEEEGPVVFLIAFFFAVLFVIAAIGGLVTFLNGRQKPPSKEVAMFCKNCGKEVSDTTEICLGCGARPLAGNGFCQACGAQTNPMAEICIKCGVRLRKA